MQKQFWGGTFIAQRGDVGTVELRDCLITDGLSLNRAIIAADGSATIRIDGCTIANNAKSSPADESTPPLSTLLALSPATHARVQHSILWQPEAATIDAPGASLGLVDVIVHDAAFLGTLPLDAFENVFDAEPHFIDAEPAYGFVKNYRLRGDSPAIDSASTPVESATDLVGHPRGHGLAGNGHPFDIGAYERQGFVAPVTFPSDERFDELDDPEHETGALPAGWTAAHTGDQSGWIASPVLFANNGNPTTGLAAFSPDILTAGDSVMDSPVFAVTRNARLSFHQNVSLEDSPVPGFAFDGAVLEIRIGDEPGFRDILDAGGRFVSNGYNRTLFGPASTGCPIGGRRAWSGDSAGYETVVVDLPASADGRNVQLRWRVGTDASGGEYSLVTDGYWVDDVHVDVDLQAQDIIFLAGFEHD